MSEKVSAHTHNKEFNENDKKIVFEQYKLLIDSLNSYSNVRELSNPYWITVTGLGLGGVSYVKETTTICLQHKEIILWTLISLGTVLCLAWINYLLTLKHMINVRNRLIMELEECFPVKVFTQIFRMTGGAQQKYSLTIREMLIPVFFLLGYISFAVFLFFFTEEVALPSHTG